MMPNLLETDAYIYRRLCWYVRHMMPFPGVDLMAREVGYKNGQSVRESLRRLEVSGYIELKGDRQLSSIVIKPSGVVLPVRQKVSDFARRGWQ